MEIVKLARVNKCPVMYRHCVTLQVRFKATFDLCPFPIYHNRIAVHRCVNRLQSLFGWLAHDVAHLLGNDR